MFKESFKLCPCVGVIRKATFVKSACSFTLISVLGFLPPPLYFYLYPL